MVDRFQLQISFGFRIWLNRAKSGFSDKTGFRDKTGFYIRLASVIRLAPMIDMLHY